MAAHLPEFNLSVKCTRLCTSAESVLEDTCSLIKSGSITLLKLSQVEEKRGHVDKLLKEALSNNDFKVIQQLLRQRFLERKHFTKRLNHLRQFCHNINITVKGKL